MTLQDITQQFDYIYWARDRVLTIMDTIDAADFTKDLQSSHKSIHETFVHMFGSEKLWMTRWKGESPTGREKPEDYPTVQAVRQRWGEIESDVRAHLNSMKPEDAAKMVEYKTLEGAPVAYPWWQTAFQVTNHSSYHRGQVITMLRQLGAKATGTDIIMYFKFQNAKA